MVSTGPLTDAAGRDERAQPPPGLPARVVHGEPEVGAGVGGEHAGAADVGHDRDRPARGRRLGREQRRGPDQLAEARRGDDPRLLEQRLPADQRGGDRRGVRRGGALAGLAAPGVHGEHRHLRAPTRRAVRAELARVAERLDVQHGELGLPVLLPPHQHVVARHVELVADRGERGDADAEPGQVVHHGEAEAAGLHDEARRCPAPGWPRRTSRRARSTGRRCRSSWGRSAASRACGRRRAGRRRPARRRPR